MIPGYDERFILPIDLQPGDAVPGHGIVVSVSGRNVTFRKPTLEERKRFFMSGDEPGGEFTFHHLARALVVYR